MLMGSFVMPDLCARSFVASRLISAPRIDRVGLSTNPTNGVCVETERIGEGDLKTQAVVHAIPSTLSAKRLAERCRFSSRGVLSILVLEV